MCLVCQENPFVNITSVLPLQLASYPYIDMFDELEMVIESRARSVDLALNNYYDFLYSFHISKENYRKGYNCLISNLINKTLIPLKSSTNLTMFYLYIKIAFYLS